MPSRCEVPFCRETGAHRFPRIAIMRKKWLKAIRRKKFIPQVNSRICRKHFTDSDYQHISFYTGLVNQHRYLKKTTVPSIFPWTKNKQDSVQAQLQKQRLINWNLEKKLESETAPIKSNSIENRSVKLEKSPEKCETDYGFLHIYLETCKEEIEETEDVVASTDLSQIETKKYFITHSSCGTQTSGLRIFCTELLQADDELVMFYTGLESYSKFVLVMNTLLPMANNLKYCGRQVASLSVEDQFLILLIKLRRNKPDLDIATMFNISKTEVSNIILTWIHFVHDLWSLIDIWPKWDLINKYLPKSFKTHSIKPRIVIDTTEVPMNKPSSRISRRATYSSYKNTNTVKFLVGSTPDGLLCYYSKGYGGATSDREMIEVSGLIDKCDERYSILADSRFDLQELFAVKKISINTPTVSNGKSQTPGIIMKHDQRLARQRLHIERIVDLTETYNIFKTPLTAFYEPLTSEIFFICFMLCNFKENVIRLYRE